MEEINIVTEEAIETPAEGTTVPVSEPVTQESADTDRAEVSVLLPPACKTVEVLSTGMDTGCLFQQCCAAIDTCVQNIEQNYLQIARNLHFLQKTKLYRQEGCSNIYELALKRWNLSKTTCSNLLGICRRFCKQNPDTGMY